MLGAQAVVAPLVIGRYAIHNAIASGGMGTVHLGRLLGAVGFSRTVAIKRLHRQFASDPEFVAMFLDEARIAARIRHPNVVPTIDVVATAGEIFIVMEYVQGESLSQLLKELVKRGERMPPRIGATIIRDVLQGLHAAHEAKDENGIPLGIVHRDVSPQNVIVGIDGVTRVFDFGVAKATGRAGQATRAGELKGKLAYMAPEQLLGSGVTRVADVFAASVVLWETLTGERLFRGDSEGNVINKVLHEPIRAPSEVLPALGNRFDALVLRGLERDSTKRFSSAREMALDLAKIEDLAHDVEVGEWVEQLAHFSIVGRAASVARVERSSSKNLSVGDFAPAAATDPPIDAEPQEHGVDGATRTILDVSRDHLGQRPSRRGRWAAGAGAFILLMALGVLTVAKQRPPPPQPLSSAAASSSPPFPSPAQTLVSNATGAPTSSTSAPAAVVSSASSSVSAAPRPRPMAPALRPSHAPPPTPTRTAAERLPEHL